MSNVILDLNTRKAAPFMASASIIKPLIVWLALKKEKSASTPIPNRETLPGIIITSDNIPTSNLVQNFISLPEITEQLNKILEADNETKHLLTTPETWGQYQVSGRILYALFKALATEHSPESEQVIQWMKETETVQRFGFLNKDTAVKAGWDLNGKKMSLLIALIDQEEVKIFLTTSHELEEKVLLIWDEKINNTPETLPEFHEKIFQRQLALFNTLAK